MFCKSRLFASVLIGSNATVCATSAVKSMAATAFKSLASTNFAMPAHLGFTGFSSILATDVLQTIPSVLQNTFMERSKVAGTPFNL